MNNEVELIKINKKTEYKNFLSEDGAVLTIYPPENTIKEYKEHLNETRFVFTRENERIQFKGVFAPDMVATNIYQHVLRRIATEVRVIGEPVTRIEILK